MADRPHESTDELPELLGEHRGRELDEAERRRVRRRLLQHVDRRLHRHGERQEPQLHAQRLLLHGRLHRRRHREPAGVRPRVRQRRRLLLQQRQRLEPRRRGGAGGRADYPQGDSSYHQRYAPVGSQSNQQDAGYQYCTGDQIFGNADGSTGPPPTTTYTVFKAVVPGQPGSAQQVCQVSYPGYSGDLAAILGTGGTVAGAPDRSRRTSASGQRSARSAARPATSTSSRSRPTTAARGTTASRCAPRRRRARPRRR